MVEVLAREGVAAMTDNAHCLLGLLTKGRGVKPRPEGRRGRKGSREGGGEKPGEK